MTEEQIEKKPMSKGWKKFGMVVAGAWVVIIAGCVATMGDEEPKEEKPKTEQKAEKKTEKVVKKAATWQEALGQKIGNGTTPTEQYDWTVQVAKDYPIKSQEELVEYTDDIIASYESKEYLANPTNQKYMMENMYKAQAIHNLTGKDSATGKTTLIGEFAFDFLQNSKYVYRGVDAPNSDAVKANEAQMNKVLIQVQQILGEAQK